MLQELHVRNLALIDELKLEFDPGFNVLTGETGAGKSIIIDALGLVLGERFSSEMIRTGADSLWVEAFFNASGHRDLESFLGDAGIPVEEDHTLILQREVNSTGKNRCRVNGNLVTVLLLQKIGGFLIDIHGQHEHQSLLFPEKQLELLDQYCGEACLEYKNKLGEVYAKWGKLTAKRRQLRENQAETLRRIELCRYQSQEIHGAKLVIGEDEELQKERQILTAAEKLLEASRQAYRVIYENDGQPAVVELLGEAQRALNQVAGVDERLEANRESLANLIYQTEELSRDLRSYQDQIEIDPNRLASIEERLNELTQLKRKYAPTLAEILLHAQACDAELRQLEEQEEHSGELEAELEAERVKLGGLAEALTALRQAGAARLGQAICSQLSDLNMAKTQFMVQLCQTQAEEGVPYRDGNVAVTATGADQIEFLLAPNPGEAMKPLAKIASGGELSRIMLALKAILAELDQTPTMVFDEIDVGIGGRTAQAVAEKILYIGEARQVICVTHLPQIASMAKRHFYIEKQVSGERTRVTVRALDMEQRTEELARMLGGAAVTATTREHAREMLDMAEHLRVRQNEERNKETDS